LTPELDSISSENQKKKKVTPHVPNIWYFKILYMD
jgi:hypothetical protein